MDKISFYSQKKIVSNYEKQRFGGKAGKFVNHKEIKFIITKINKNAKRVLDAPCGTGRLIKKMDFVPLVIGLDSSKEMIKQAKKNLPHRKILQGNLFKLPFKNNYFDCIIHLRIFHHYPLKKIKKIIDQSTRVLKNRGILLFDTYNKSPKALLSWLMPKSVHRAYLHKDVQIKKMLLQKGFKNIKLEKGFLLSPLTYRFLPFFIIKFLEKIEKYWPRKLLVKTFWQAEKIKN